MLTLPEKILFILAVAASLALTWRNVVRIVRAIGRGHGRPDWRLAVRRIVNVVIKIASMAPTFKTRTGVSLLHAFVAWAFIYYLLVNLGDVLEAFIPGFQFLGDTTLAGIYRLIADMLTVAALFGMAALLLRRFIFKTPALKARENVLLHPRAVSGIRRDSLIVGAFILIHVGGRFMGETFKIAAKGQVDSWQPFASTVSVAWSGLSASTILVGEHIAFWLAIGTIVAFLPYFPYSKHIHLFFAPLNFLLKPERSSMGALSPIDFDDESLETFGVSRLEDLGYEQLMDAYACIMCYRCQDACPAYNTGKVLSPATLEINKRYFLNSEVGKIAAGESSGHNLLEFAITEEAIWACTACGACVEVCPVNNEPMRDILDIRRALVLMDNSFPNQFQTAFRGMERSVNPWNVPPTERMKWAEGLDVPTIDSQPEPDILWWVGCAPAIDARAQKTARALAKVMQAAGVKYAVLGQVEQCTGDSARRAGNDYLFFELAKANVEILNEVAPPRIVTTCPHCLHTLKNEYPDFGGNYRVIHHSELINELLLTDKLTLKSGAKRDEITFHDPCYLGRQNGIIDAPRLVLSQAGAKLTEMPRNSKQSFCCGAGGAQMWKEEEEGEERVSIQRFKEARATGAETLAVGCPFCMVMLTDAAKEVAPEMEVKDIAEIVADALAG
jgi:Fe-S oxidoreductase